jgi:hypothetical protein
VSEIGTFINPDNVTRLIKGLCKTAGVPYKSVHKMRHTSLSLYHASGATSANFPIGQATADKYHDRHLRHTTDQRTPFSIEAVLNRLKRRSPTGPCWLQIGLFKLKSEPCCSATGLAFVVPDDLLVVGDEGLEPPTSSL